MTATAMARVGAVSDLVGMTRRMIAEGIPWRQAAERIERETSGEREPLQGAVARQVEEMHPGPSDDLAAISVLRALERALASTARVSDTGPISAK